MSLPGTFLWHAYFDPNDGTHHIPYRTGNGHVHELVPSAGKPTLPIDNALGADPVVGHLPDLNGKNSTGLVFVG